MSVIVFVLAAVYLIILFARHCFWPLLSAVPVLLGATAIAGVYMFWLLCCLSALLSAVALAFGDRALVNQFLVSVSLVFVIPSLEARLKRHDWYRNLLHEASRSRHLS
ncbi:MAG: hypothetical protein U0790_17800 [Isosphaeraceae bacterium]